MITNVGQLVFDRIKDKDFIELSSQLATANNAKELLRVFMEMGLHRKPDTWKIQYVAGLGATKGWYREFVTLLIKDLSLKMLETTAFLDVNDIADLTDIGEFLQSSIPVLTKPLSKG